MRNTIQAADKAFRWGQDRKRESTLRKIAMAPVRMMQKAVSLLSIHTSSWFVGLAARWGETDYIALARAGHANPYVKRAYELVKDNLSSIIIQAFTGRGDDRKEVENHPFLQVLRRPNAETGYQGFIEKIVAHLFYGGELFFYAPDSPLTGQNAGVPRPGRRWELIRPDRVTEIKYAENGERAFYTVQPVQKRGLFNLTAKDIPAGRIKHVKLYNPTDEQRGYPLLLSAWRQVQLMEASDDWNKSVADGKGRVPGFFKYKGEGPLDDKQFDRTKEKLQESYEKDQKESRPGMLDGDFDWVQAGVSQKDVDWIQGDLVAGRKIAIALGVDPALLGDQGSRTLANLNEALRHLLLLRVLPLLDWLLDEWDHHFMAAYGEARLAYAREQLEPLQEDWNQKTSRLGTAVENSLMTINEARGELNLHKRDEPEAEVLWKPLSREILGATDTPLSSGDGQSGEPELDLSGLAQLTDSEFKAFTEEKLPAMLHAILAQKNGNGHA